MTQVTASETAADANDTLPTGIGHDPVRDFCQDAILLDRLQVTAQELEALSQSSLLGSISSKQDVLFMLRTIRGCPSPDSEDDKTAAIYFEMTQEIRRSALGRIAEKETQRRAVRQPLSHRLGLHSDFLRAVWQSMGSCLVRQPARLLRQCRESVAFAAIVCGRKALLSTIIRCFHQPLAKVRGLQNWRAVGETIGSPNGDSCDVDSVRSGIVRCVTAPAPGEHSRRRIHRRRRSRRKIPLS